MESRRCAKPTIELVQTGPSLILKLKEMAIYHQKLCFASPTKFVQTNIGVTKHSILQNSERGSIQLA